MNPIQIVDQVAPKQFDRIMQTNDIEGNILIYITTTTIIGARPRMKILRDKPYEKYITPFENPNYYKIKENEYYQISKNGVDYVIKTRNSKQSNNVMNQSQNTSYDT